MSDLRGLNYVRDFKAIPSDVGINRSVANGLEDAIADGSIALMARAMGKDADYRYSEKELKIISCIIAYLYNYIGKQWKTAEKVRYIMDEFYHDRPDGIIGNEDCGQMSAWYIFSSLGFYPVFPASGQYVIGSPKFDTATIKLPQGKSFTVTAVNNSPKNIYIQSVELNGKAYNRTFIEHQDIVKGGTMKFVMGSKPNYRYGADSAQRP